MMKTFKALRVHEDTAAAAFSMQVQTRDLHDLPAGEVLVRVRYSSLNYKDALVCSGHHGITRDYPHTPGIDAAGEVVASTVDAFSPGDAVVVTGYDLGMNTDGGFGQYIRVPAAWVLPLPEGLSLAESMVLGTAGLTAAQCIMKLQRMGLAPDQGEVLVTGASGGVGSLAVQLLHRLGYRVAAATGTLEQAQHLHALGASKIIDRETLLEGTERALLAPQWAGAVDTVGGEILFNVIKGLQRGGSVACCGLVASARFDATVFPFILRGVHLLGVDSAEQPRALKAELWRLLGHEWKLDGLLAQATEVGLDALLELVPRMLKGRTQGRILLNLDR